MWIAIVVMGLLIMGYFIGQLLTKEFVLCVEAGPMTGVSAEDLRRKSFYATRAELQDHGKTVSTRKMIRIVVNGGCMKLRNIEEDTQLCVEKKAKDADLKG